jgi:hypothetical protein
LRAKRSNPDCLRGRSLDCFVHQPARLCRLRDLRVQLLALAGDVLIVGLPITPASLKCSTDPLCAIATTATILVVDEMVK